MKDVQDLPLVISLVGPMAFMRNNAVVDIWLPTLDDPLYRHQAGVGTSVESQELGQELREYYFEDPDPMCSSDPSEFSNPLASIPFEATPLIYPPTDFFVHLTLPRPKWIIGYSPVSCEIYPSGSTPNEIYYNRPVGFQFFYSKAGAPILKSVEDPDFSYPLIFDPVPDETQLAAFIAYMPYNSADPTASHVEAKEDFRKLAQMCGLSLDLEFAPVVAAPHIKGGLTHGPVQNCKAPVILLDS